MVVCKLVRLGIYDINLFEVKQMCQLNAFQAHTVRG